MYVKQERRKVEGGEKKDVEGEEGGRRKGKEEEVERR
jgi:hypothetical protein